MKVGKHKVNTTTMCLDLLSGNVWRYVTHN